MRCVTRRKGLRPGTTFVHLRLGLTWLRGLDPPSPLSPKCRGHGSQFFNWTLVMKIQRFAGHHEASQALWLAAAGVTTIMLIMNLFLLILY